MDGTALQNSAIIDPTRDLRWDAFVHAHAGSSAFHTSAWARVLADTYDYQPRYCVILDADRQIRAGWPFMLVSSRFSGKRLVSLPFCDHCEPLVDGPRDAALLLNAIIEYGAGLGADRIECRGWPTDLELPQEFHAVHSFALYTAELPTDSAGVLLSMSATARRYARQAERKGVSVRLSRDRGDLEHFYRFNVMLRRRHGMLSQPLSFFLAIYRHLIDQGLGQLFLAELENQPVAALLCLTYGTTFICKFAASDPAYWDYRPNHLLMWKSLAWASGKGFQLYDFGRCGAGDQGLMQFKEQCGFKARDLPYYFYPEPGGFTTAEPTGTKKRLLSAFSRYAPTPLFLAAGKYMYRHLG